MEELLILVDDNDKIVGYEEKMKTHIHEKLHRAFSLFIYDKDKKLMLMHKRAYEKYHSVGLWTNSCCSHPRKGEDLRTAIERRTKQELGLKITDKQLKLDSTGSYEHGLHELGSFKYYKKFSECAEHEIDHVFYLPLHSHEITLNINPSEISEINWISLDKLKPWLTSSPKDFTPWFAQAFNMVLNKVFNDSLAL